MEGFSPAWAWAVLGMVLALSELMVGAFVLLALGIAALLTALVTLLLPIDLPGQLGVMAVISGGLVPLAIFKIKPRFSPKSVNYGTAGTSAVLGQTFTVEPMSFDRERMAIKIEADQFPIKPADDTEIRVGDRVSLERFEGATAVVHLSDRTSRVQAEEQ